MRRPAGGGISSQRRLDDDVDGPAVIEVTFSKDAGEGGPIHVDATEAVRVRVIEN